MQTTQDVQLRPKRLTTQYSNDRIMLQTTSQNLRTEQLGLEREMIRGYQALAQLSCRYADIYHRVSLCHTA